MPVSKCVCLEPWPCPVPDPSQSSAEISEHRPSACSLFPFPHWTHKQTAFSSRLKGQFTQTWKFCHLLTHMPHARLLLLKNILYHYLRLIFFYHLWWWSQFFMYFLKHEHCFIDFKRMDKYLRENVKNILIFVPKMNESHIGLEQHKGKWWQFRFQGELSL